MNVSKNVVQPQGRVLQAPQLNPSGHKDKLDQVATGNGRPIVLVSLCLDVDCPDHQFYEFNRKLIATAQTFGMQINLSLEQFIKLRKHNDLTKVLDEIRSTVTDVDLVLTVIPKRGEYSTIRI